MLIQISKRSLSRQRRGLRFIELPIVAAEAVFGAGIEVNLDLGMRGANFLDVGQGNVFVVFGEVQEYRRV
jgi:hypothetical protein